MLFRESRRFLGPFLGALLIAVAPGAQSQSSKVLARYGKPLRSVSLDLSTGTITRGVTVGNRAATTVEDFKNIDLGGFVGLDSGNGFCEWFDAGVKGQGNVGDLMSSIVFAYCSAKLTPSSGGPGGSVKLGFYEGYVAGGAVPTTTVACFTLSGLPANTASSSFFGGFRCFFTRITFGSLVPFADGPIGYSWRFLDSGTSVVDPRGSVLAGTWPFLACVVSCSGTLGQVDGQGMTDEIDAYCPVGTLRSTFSFGTSSGSYTSIGMAIEEVTDKPSTVLLSNSSTFPNPDILSAVPATIGKPWTATLTLGLQRAPAMWFLRFGKDEILPPTGQPIGPIIPPFDFGTAKAGRMLLCSMTYQTFVATAHTGNSGGVSTSVPVAIPTSLALVCNTWCSQAIVLGQVLPAGNGNIRLSSMAKGTVGTF